VGFFDDLGLEDRAARRAARTGTGAPVNTTQPVGPPMAAAQPGMTAGDVNRLVNDPTNGRLSGSGVRPSDRDIQAILSKYPTTNDGFLQAVAELDATYGKGVWGEYLDHPSRLDKIRLPDGRTIDAMYAAGTPDARWEWMVEGPGHGGGSSLGQLGGAVSGQWQNSLSPGFGFRVGEMSKALQQRAAAKGTIATGGFAKELAQYVNNLAGDEYEAAFGRNLSLAQLGLQATGQAAGLGSNYSNTLGQNTANQVQTNTDLTTGAANARAGVTAGNAAGMGNTIGELGTILAPSAANWLKKIRGKGADTGRSPYLDLREGTV
jgi:hypothetical protein